MHKLAQHQKHYGLCFSHNMCWHNKREITQKSTEKP